MFDPSTPNYPTENQTFMPESDEKPVEDIFEPADNQPRPVEERPFRQESPAIKQAPPINLPTEPTTESTVGPVRPTVRPMAGPAPEKIAWSAENADAEIAAVDEDEITSRRLPKSKKFFLLGLIGLVAIGLIVGGWWAFTKLRAPASENPAVNNNNELLPTTNQPENQNPSGNPSGNPATPTNPNVSVEPPLSELDSDGDGLTDAEELTLGTDPGTPDTDHDGLFDREEVKVYQTDPLNADSDGDGYLDGEEVHNGFNPKGEGRLTEINQ